MPEILVRLKNPSDSNNFIKYDKDDYNVYINKDLISADSVRIKFPEYASDLPERELEVIGLKIPRPQ